MDNSINVAPQIVDYLPIRRTMMRSAVILERLVHNAHRIEMRWDSMRKNRGKPNA